MIGAADWRLIVRTWEARGLLHDAGWSLPVGVPDDAGEFVLGIVFAICCNSSIRLPGARFVFDRVREALLAQESVLTVFGQRGKAAAIDWMWRERETLLAEYRRQRTDAERLECLGSLPGVGESTRRAIAGQFGLGRAADGGVAASTRRLMAVSEPEPA